jgi:hypothetical protein
MNQIFESTTKTNGTPSDLDQGHAHVKSFQTPMIEEGLPNNGVPT